MSEGAHVVSNLAATVDGKIASSRGEIGFTSREDRKRVDVLRARADALVVGAGTVRSEDPPLRVQSAERRAERVRRGQHEELIVAIVSASGRLPATARFLREPAHDRRLYVAEESLDGARERLSEVVERGALGVYAAGEGTSLDPRRVVRALVADGAETILLEGGGETLAAFLDAEVVDEMRVTICPTVLGGRAAPTLVGGEGWPLASRKRLALRDLERIGDELFLTYEVE